MTKIDEIIELLGDALEKIRVLCERPDLGPHERKSLEDRKDRLRKMQRSLAKDLFEKNTPIFKEQAKNIDEVNKRLQAAMREMDEVVQTTQSLGKVVGVFDEVLNLAFKVAI
jgi:hypothetical protein